jgi:hypothetical protein
MVRLLSRSTAVLVSTLALLGGIAVPALAAPESDQPGAAAALAPGGAVQLRGTRGVPITGVVATFTDTAPGPINDEQAFVEAAFSELVGHAPDAGGLDYWRFVLEQGSSRSVLTAALVFSDEWDRREVGKLYASYLKRAPSPGEAGYWAGIIRSNGLDVVRAAILSSDEYFAANGRSNDAFISAVYQQILERPAEPNGRAYWVQRLNTGTPRSLVAGGLAGSDEAHSRLTDHLIADLLNRPASAGDLAIGIGVLRGGFTEPAFIANLVASDEYLASLPNVYSATASWAASGPLPAKVRRTPGGGFEVESSRALPSTGTYDIDVVVKRATGEQTSIRSTVEVIAPRNERWLDGDYTALFGRPLDPSAAAAWLPPLFTGGPGARGSVSLMLLASPEGRAHLVGGVYADYLKRTPSSAEAAYWGGALNGQPLRSVRAAILGSGEMFAKGGGSNTGYVNVLYPLVVGRPADGSGRSYYVGLLDAGTSRSTVADALLGSLESGGVLVSAAYERTLARAPGASERSFWAATMAAGVSEQRVIASLLASFERFERYPRP